MQLPSPTLPQRLERWRGSTVQYDLRPFAESLESIQRLEASLQNLEDGALQAHSSTLAQRAQAGEDLHHLLPDAFALVREAARRVLGQRPYDVQMLAAMALFQGNVVEMQTGEGKTLAAVAPAYLHGLTGGGVHVLTFNDYLAERDAAWMGPVYGLLGLSAASVTAEMSSEARRSAYLADVTYVTAKEAGFDFLRDQLLTTPNDAVQRPLHVAIVDEADSILIDEASVPLVVAGPREGAVSEAARVDDLARRFEAGRHYALEADGTSVEILEAGLDEAERSMNCGDVTAKHNLHLLTALHCAVTAHHALQQDVDYLVRDDQIEMIDGFTGRVSKDRHWPDGMQAALEAKEGLRHRGAGRILASISLQHFLGSYERLCGMTGTARESAQEIHETYGLGVTVIPTHRPCLRIDHPHLVFGDDASRDDALVDDICRVHDTGRPVLVGTSSVAASEGLAKRLRDADVACEVLNARNDHLEAEIIARAGRWGAVTISTHMAGRGTDIRLGIDDADRQRIVELGGLYVLGTDLSESPRVDRQLQGRAGRQGDPGASRFFLSLDDDLPKRFDLRRLLPRSVQPHPSSGLLEHPVVGLEMARLQRMAQGQSREIRKALWDFASPMEDQRQRFQEERRRVLLGNASRHWTDLPRFQSLAEQVGVATLETAETRLTLHHMDRAWSDHLEAMDALREDVHLVGLGGEDPQTVFRLRAAEAFRHLQDTVQQRMRETLDEIEVRDGRLNLEALGITAPSATWTYLVNDDPFRNQLGRQLTAPGSATLAVGAAMLSGPFFLLWLAAERWWRRRSRP